MAIMQRSEDTHVALVEIAHATISHVLEKNICVKGSWAQTFVDELLYSYCDAFGVQHIQVAVHLTGRKAHKKLGYYDVKGKAIYINNAGMSDYGLRTTLIHELAHHIQHTCRLVEGTVHLKTPGKPHGKQFNICHWRLRQLAFSCGKLVPLDKYDATLGLSAQKICGIRRRNGQQVLDAGKLLFAARERCHTIQENFEVFLQDSVTLHRTTAYEYIRAWEMHLSPELSFTTMRFIMRIKDKDRRDNAIEDALRGVPLNILRIRYEKIETCPVPENEVAALLKKRGYLESQLARVEKRLRELGYTQRRHAARMRP